MKRTNALALLTASIIVICGNVSNASATESITLKGLSVESNVTEIEAVFGACGDSDDHGWHYCGGSDTNAYKKKDDGSIYQIYFQCSMINSCDVPVPVLARIIESKKPEIIEVEISKDDFIQKATLYGDAGDTLVLMSFREDGRNAVISLNAGNAVSLD